MMQLRKQRRELSPIHCRSRISQEVRMRDHIKIIWSHLWNEILSLSQSGKNRRVHFRRQSRQTPPQAMLNFVVLRERHNQFIAVSIRKSAAISYFVSLSSLFVATCTFLQKSLGLFLRQSHSLPWWRWLAQVQLHETKWSDVNWCSGVHYDASSCNDTME